ncbi:MAG: LysM peptidoglycan-binding domain-containing protein [Deltaproteobacteria bacterium]|nr:LysM peptidoglycan-binding domain-containing protein [Deltaproteobacteria bacterium]
MFANGKLEKMLILAFESSEQAEGGGVAEAKERVEAFINPESYTLEYKVKTADGQAPGTSPPQLKFQYIMPEELSFEFLFDNTGLIDGIPKPDGIYDDVDHFRQVLTKYRGPIHEPYHLKLIWGNLVFKGRAIELSITHKLFNPDGQPIRSVAKVKFKGSIEEKKRASMEGRGSSDLTHVRTVKAGDHLSLLCHRIYGDPRHYLSVAKANGLGNFRKVKPGTDLVFPPIEKAGKAT